MVGAGRGPLDQDESPGRGAPGPEPGADADPEARVPHRPGWPGIIEAYRDLLPVTPATPIVTLLEGATPLIPATRLSERLGVDVRLEVAATKEAILADLPELVVVATGAAPLPPAFPVDGAANVTTIWDVLGGTVAVPERIVEKL